MRKGLIQPIAAPLWDSEPETVISPKPVQRTLSAVPRRQRARADRVLMCGSGYRVVIDNQPVALINLSVSGAQVRGPVDVARDQPIIFKIGWPQDRKALCSAIARVRWVYEESDELHGERVYCVGLAFETWDVRRLKDILRSSERPLTTKDEAIDPW